jgi:hypothetical protein
MVSTNFGVIEAEFELFTITQRLATLKADNDVLFFAESESLWRALITSGMCQNKTFTECCRLLV